ncbi:SDR family NAD(P)-dependent oxidoreductase [Phenylobacterium sp. J367]|nr:SDR family NAD(P)-dependent oxidoreductase [Phenylobacterium sp. J367]
MRQLDVTDRADYRAALDAFAPAAGGRLDILYNNAGIGRGGPFDQQPWEDIVAVVQVNLMGVLIGIYEAVPLLKATPGSMCFTTSSSSATFGMPGIAVYSATKHAVKGLTEALSVEFKAYGIKVADVLPGLIDTPILPPGRRSRAEGRHVAGHAAIFGRRGRVGGLPIRQAPLVRAGGDRGDGQDGYARARSHARAARPELALHEARLGP